MDSPTFTVSAGPTTVSARVLAALGSPVTYHYDPGFLEQFRSVERKVAEIFGTKSDVVLMQGEAVLGLEAAARSLVQPEMSVLNCVSGVFGKYMGVQLRVLGARVYELEVPYTDVVSPAEVDRFLDSHPDVALVTVVHCETPSGTLHDLSSIGPIAKAHGALVLVDCVSSFGGMPLLPDEWGLDLCVAGPQKCLGGPPGMSLLYISRDAWLAIESNPHAPRGSFLSILDWREQWHGQGKFPYTPSVSEIHGVNAACDELLQEGLEHAYTRHASAARACREGVRAMGLEVWASREEIASPSVTAVRLPESVSDIQVRDHARNKYGVMLSSGQGTGNLVRIGHMGCTARSFFPVVGLLALGRTLLDLNCSVRIGDGVEAALAVMASTDGAHI